MKRYILVLLSVICVAVACGKNDDTQNFSVLKNQKSELVRDWIGLQLRVIKNTTGVTHVAYSRHFAYTGVAFYESLVNGDNKYKSIAGSLNGTLVLPEAPQGKPLFWPASANAAMADMLRFFIRQNRKTSSALTPWNRCITTSTALKSIMPTTLMKL